MREYIMMTDGRWFDRNTTEWWEEYRPGRRSVHTGEEFRGVVLGRTASGTWVFHEWSRWENEPDRYVPVDDLREVARWFVRNDSVDEAPDDIRRLIESEQA
jgi:hypothetical protein